MVVLSFFKHLINSICFFPILLYHHYTMEIVLILLYIIISIAEIGALITDILYLTKCNLTKPQYNLIIFNLILIGIILLRRIVMFTSSNNSITTTGRNRSRSINCLKTILYLTISSTIYIMQIVIYEKIDISNNCTSKITTTDRNVIQLMFGLIISIYEIKEFYNIVITIQNDINSNRIVPIVIIVESENEVQKNKLIDKINNLQMCTTVESENSKNCSICLSDDNNINLENKFVLLPNCNHSYHKECIVEWVKQRITSSTNCPVCRTAI